MNHTILAKEPVKCYLSVTWLEPMKKAKMGMPKKQAWWHNLMDKLKAMSTTWKTVKTTGDHRRWRTKWRCYKNLQLEPFFFLALSIIYITLHQIYHDLIKICETKNQTGFEILWSCDLKPWSRVLKVVWNSRDKWWLKARQAWNNVVKKESFPYSTKSQLLNYSMQEYKPADKHIITQTHLHVAHMNQIETLTTAISLL